MLDLLKKKTLNKVFSSFYQRTEDLRYQIEIMEEMLIITVQKELFKENFTFIDVTLSLHIDLINMEKEDRLLKEASLVTRTKKGFNKENLKINSLDLLLSNTILSSKELKEIKEKPSLILESTRSDDWIKNKKVDIKLDIKSININKKESNETIDLLLKEIAMEKLSEMILEEMNRNPNELLLFIDEVVSKQNCFMAILKRPSQIIKFLRENKNETEKNLIDFSFLDFSN